MKTHRRMGLALFFSGIFVFFGIFSLYSFAFLRKIICLGEPLLPLFLICFSLLPLRRAHIPKFVTQKMWGKRLLLHGMYFVLPGLCILFFVFPVFRHWCQLPPGIDAGYSALGGVIPWSDAAGYYEGAQHFQNTGNANEFNSRRPLNTILFSLRLALTGNDFQSSLLINAVLLGIACWLCVTTISVNLGSRVGLCFFGFLLGYGRWFVSLVLTETLGLTLGVLAFSILWSAIRFHSSTLLFAGIFFQTVALNTRAGAFFILPCLFIWSIWKFWNRTWKKGTGALVFILFIVLSFAFQSSLVRLYGTGKSFGHANFAHTFYGIATGGRGWTSFSSDFPEVQFKDEAELSKIVFQKAFEALIQNPTNFPKGILNNYAYSIPALGWNIFKIAFGFKDNPNSRAIMVMTSLIVWFILLWGYVKFYYQYRSSLVTGFLTCGLIGFFLSLPIIYPDGTVRVIASTYPFLAMFISLAIIYPNFSLNYPPPQSIARWNLSLIMALLLIFIGLIGPLLCQKFHPINELSLEGKEFPDIIASVGPGSPYINVHSADSSVESFIPEVNAKDFFSDPTFGGNEVADLLRTLKPPFALAFLFSLGGKKIKRGNSCIAVFPQGLTPTSSTIMKLSLEKTRKNGIYQVITCEPWE